MQAWWAIWGFAIVHVKVGWGWTVFPPLDTEGCVLLKQHLG